jgi:FkbM family methyltransferase
MNGLATREEHLALEKALRENRVKVITYAMIDANLNSLPEGTLTKSNVIANFDSDPAKWWKAAPLGVMTMPPDKILDFINNANALLIMSQYLRPIAEALDALGVDKYYSIFAFEKHDLFRFSLDGAQHNRLFAELNIETCNKHRDEIALARSVLCDDLSLKLFDALIAARTEMNVEDCCKHVAPLTSPPENQYFPDDIKEFVFSEEEIMVDCGSYDGNDIKKLMQRAGGKFKYAYAFEPDRRCFEWVEEFARGHPNVEAIRKGVFNSAGSFFLYEEPILAQSRLSVDKNGSYEVQVCRLDDEIKGSVTFIKMDIEGSEIGALEGAERLIRTYKPKLAICVYHKFTDLWEIPLLVKKFVPEYKIFLRHHMPLSPSQTRILETVAYAAL